MILGEKYIAQPLMKFVSTVGGAGASLLGYGN